MAVFMSPRTNYVLGRFGAHSVMSWFLAFGILCGGSIMLAKPFAPTSLTLWGLTGYGLSVKQGRKAMRRTVRESFYGTLGSFTGVASVGDNDEIGGGSAVESE